METLQNLIGDVIHGLGLDPTATFFGNTALEYGLSIALFVVAIVIFKGIQWVTLRQLKRLAEKTATDLDDTFVKIVRSFNPPFYTFLAFWVALRPLSITGFGDKFLTAILIIWAVYQAIIAVGILIEDVLFKKFAKEADPTTQSALRIITRLVKGALWGLGIILMLSNLGVDVSSLLAGVGIGGVAIAFALQGILSDLFASFSIYFDKPFKVGDFIIVGDTLGTVERIGIKSTRLRSLTGEEIVKSNKELTGATIQNYHDMEERRITFGFGILYETPYEKVKKAPELVRQAVESTKETRFDRAHFKQFGDSSLDFEVVYYVLTGDYNRYMDIQQEINLKIVEAFEREGISFAYPTRTLYLSKMPTGS